jgi:hypothetical protein
VNPDHLFLGTLKDNTRDMMKKGRNASKPHPGESNCKAKLTDLDIPVVRHLVNVHGVVQRLVAELFGVNQQSVSMIAKRQTWRHIA